MRAMPPPLPPAPPPHPHPRNLLAKWVVCRDPGGVFSGCSRDVIDNRPSEYQAGRGRQEFFSLGDVSPEASRARIKTGDGARIPRVTSGGKRSTRTKIRVFFSPEKTRVQS